MSQRDLTERLALTLTDLAYETWNFGDSVAFEALIEASDVLGDERWAAFAHGWSRSWATRALPRRRLDCTAPGRAMVHLAERSHDDRLLAATVELAHYLTTRPRLRGVYETWEHSPLMHPYGPAVLDDAYSALVDNSPAGVFLDCLHFDPPFFAAVARATGSESFAREAVEQALGYVAALQTPDGLFQHFVLRDHEGTFGPGWGRGQGWAILGMLEVLDEFDGMPAEIVEPHTEALERIAEAVADLIAAMLRLQRADGHWFAVVNDVESGDEFSTAAFMGAGFLQALARGAVHAGTEASVERAALSAVDAVRRGILEDGTLAEVSAAVMACTEPSHYAHVPRGFRVPWGQGPALLALTAQHAWDQRNGS